MYAACAHEPYETNLGSDGLYAPDGTLHRWAPGRLKVHGPDGRIYDVFDPLDGIEEDDDGATARTDDGDETGGRDAIDTSRSAEQRRERAKN